MPARDVSVYCSECERLTRERDELVDIVWCFLRSTDAGGIPLEKACHLSGVRERATANPFIVAIAKGA